MYSSSFMNDFIKKYARNIIILNKNNEFKTLIEAIDKGMEL